MRVAAMKWLAMLAMPLDQVKSILEATRDNWVAYRKYDGRQSDGCAPRGRA